MKLLRVDMGTERIQSEDVDEHYALLGGRGLVSALLSAELEPACDPEGPDNMLIICNGLMAGTLAASSGRLYEGKKSPLTGTIKESNAGGTAGLALARLGLRGIVVSGVSRELKVLVVGPEGARLEEASELALRGTYDACDRLRARYGAGVSIICIGPA